MPRFGAARAVGMAKKRLLASTAITNIVITGDSITQITPGLDASDFYSTNYKLYRTDKTINIRAQSGRFVGKLANLNDAGNTLMGHVSDDIAYGPQLVTILIGTNDMSGGSTAATLLADAQLYYSTITAGGGRKLAFSGPPSMNSLQQYAGYATFMGRRATFMATIRDPAVWGTLADYYIPMGEQPDLNLVDNSAYFSTDGVHPNAAGQVFLLGVYKAAVDTIIDASRISSTSPYSSVWPSSETGLATSAPITRRFIVSGIAHTGLALGASVSGGSATLSLNGNTPATSVGTGSGNGYRIYNGDTIDLAVTTSASNSTAVNVDLTIGSETRRVSYTTGAASTPITTTGAGAATQNASTTSISFPSIAVEAGTVVLALTCYSAAGGSTDSKPTTLTLTPTGGGTAITATLVHSGGRAVARAIGFYVATVASAGTYNVTGTRPAAATANVLTWVTLLDADIAQISTVAANFPANEADPHLTNSATVPANGIAIGALLKENTATGSAGANTTLLADQYQTTGGNTAGIVMGYRTTTGAVSLNNGFGTWGRLAIVIKASGT